LTLATRTNPREQNHDGTRVLACLTFASVYPPNPVSECRTRDTLALEFATGCYERQNRDLRDCSLSLSD
jgi:hypothetical protein